MKKELKLFSLILLFLLTVFILQGIYLPLELESEEKIFSVNKGDSVFKIANNLKEENLIKDPFFFNLYVFLIGKNKSLQAGEYLIESPVSTKEIAQKMAEGDALKEREITIVEGWTIKDIAEYFEKEEIFDSNRVIEKSNSLELDFDFLENDLEGYLFPDTYRIYRDDTIESVFEKMLGNFKKKVTQGLKEEIEKQERPISDIIKMASMIEKEVIDFEDKRIVAGILWKREKVNMPLQVDATINYITGRKGFDITKEEKKIDSPYNTYKYAGLPEGPICNPGLESIKSALDPKESEFWYYLSKPEGDTVFSRTLEEHNTNKAKYLK